MARPKRMGQHVARLSGEVRVYRPNRWAVATAQITDAIDAQIDDRPGEEGFRLTIVDNEAERGDETLHATLEAAKQHASAVTGVRDIRWKRR